MAEKTEFVPLAAEYSFENEYTTSAGEVKKTEKFTFSSKQYDYEEVEGSKEGYSLIHNLPLENTKSEAFANHSFLGLSDGKAASSVAVNRKVDSMDLCLFTTLRAHNGNLVKNSNGTLYAETTYNDLVTDENVFKIYLDRDEDGNRLGYLISQGDKYATVKLRMNRFNIEMKDKILLDTKNIQHFDIYQIRGTAKIKINARMVNPWGKIDGVIEDDHVFGGSWSVYDASCGVYPGKMYEGGVAHPFMVKLNGNTWDSSLIDAGASTCKPLRDIVANNCIFDSGYLSENNDRYIVVGYDGKIRWVKYFNEFYDSFYNSDTTPEKVIADIEPSIVYESPYETGISVDEKTGKIKMNFVELKDVMTPGYSYSVYDVKGENK